MSERERVSDGEGWMVNLVVFEDWETKIMVGVRCRIIGVCVCVRGREREMYRERERERVRG